MITGRGFESRAARSLIGITSTLASSGRWSLRSGRVTFSVKKNNWKSYGSYAMVSDRANDSDDAARLYLSDLGELVKDLARSAKVERDKSCSDEDRAYALGRLMALHEVVSLMQQQADLFGLSCSVLNLQDVEPERDLL